MVTKKKRSFIIVKVIVFSLIMFLLPFVIALFLVNSNTKNPEKIGITAVKELYQFEKTEDLDGNMERLKRITTDSVFSQLTVDNEERTLNTYLKFKGKTTSINVIKSTDNYVLYSLDTEFISPDRVFIFMFNVNRDGKIDYVRECECLDFLDY